MTSDDEPRLSLPQIVVGADGRLSVRASEKVDRAPSTEPNDDTDAVPLAQRELPADGRC